MQLPAFFVFLSNSFLVVVLLYSSLYSSPFLWLRVLNQKNVVVAAAVGGGGGCGVMVRAMVVILFASIVHLINHNVFVVQAKLQI